MKTRRSGLFINSTDFYRFSTDILLSFILVKVCLSCFFLFSSNSFHFFYIFLSPKSGLEGKERQRTFVVFSLELPYVLSFSRKLKVYEVLDDGASPSFSSLTSSSPVKD